MIYINGLDGRNYMRRHDKRYYITQEGMQALARFEAMVEQMMDEEPTAADYDRYFDEVAALQSAMQPTPPQKQPGPFWVPPQTEPDTSGIDWSRRDWQTDDGYADDGDEWYQDEIDEMRRVQDEEAGGDDE